MPHTRILHRDALRSADPGMPFPCIIKLPDSSFSKGVHKASGPEEFEKITQDFFSKSELIVIQEFIRTDFDWRIGILDGEPLYACKYHMAREHWQIIRTSKTGKTSYGRVQACSLAKVPPAVLEASVNACRLIGRGLYGVDLKQSGDRCYLIEVNDNPNLESGCEDSFLKDRLYAKIMKSFLKRIEARKEGKKI